MSTKTPDGDDLDTSELGEALKGSAPAGDAGEAPATAEGTEVLGDSPEDVLVLLPEGTDVPLVETEAVDDAGDFGRNTDLVGGAPTIPIEDVALRDLNPLAEDAPIGGQLDSAPPTENLEELATEMDDEFLAPETAAAPRRHAADHAPRRAAPQFIPSVDEGTERRPRRRRKLPLAVAALIAIAAVGYLTFPQWRSYVEPYLPLARADGKKKSSPPVASKGSVALPGTKAKTAPGDDGSATKATDIVRASREAFREKFLLSIELGFVGEVADE